MSTFWSAAEEAAARLRERGGSLKGGNRVMRPPTTDGTPPPERTQGAEGLGSGGRLGGSSRKGRGGEGRGEEGWGEKGDGQDRDGDPGAGTIEDEGTPLAPRGGARGAACLLPRTKGASGVPPSLAMTPASLGADPECTLGVPPRFPSLSPESCTSCLESDRAGSDQDMGEGSLGTGMPGVCLERDREGGGREGVLEAGEGKEGSAVCAPVPTSAWAAAPSDAPPQAPWPLLRCSHRGIPTHTGPDPGGASGAPGVRPWCAMGGLGGAEEGAAAPAGGRESVGRREREAVPTRAVRLPVPPPLPLAAARCRVFIPLWWRRRQEVRACHVSAW